MGLCTSASCSFFTPGHLIGRGNAVPPCLRKVCKDQALRQCVRLPHVVPCSASFIWRGNMRFWGEPVMFRVFLSKACCQEQTLTILTIEILIDFVSNEHGVATYEPRCQHGQKELLQAFAAGKEMSDLAASQQFYVLPWSEQTLGSQ